MPARSFGWGVLIPLVCFAGCQILSGGNELHTSPTTSSVTTSSAGPGGSGGSGGSDGGQGGVNAGGQGGGPGCETDCPLGSPCLNSRECASGHCADNVCCNTACNGTCQQCDDSPGDTVAAGMCRSVPTGYDPRSDCEMGSVCNGTGSCAMICALNPTPLMTGCPSQCSSCGSGVCYIDCAGNACKSKLVTCPPGYDCTLFCSGANECMEVTLDCPEAQRCNVTCTGNNACNASNIIGNTGYLNVICGTMEASCDGMVVQCGAGACQVNCEPEGASQLTVTNSGQSCNPVIMGCL